MILSTAAAFISFSLFGLGGDTVNFDNLKPKSFPPYWTATAAHPEDPSRWTVLRDSTAPSRPNVFAKMPAVVSDSEFPMAVFDKVVCRDGELSVKFKIEQSARRVKTAGIIWRYQDERNYYLLHFSVEEKTIVMFRVQNGQTHAIPIIGGKPGGFGVSHDLRTDQWYVAKVIFRGSNMKVLFGNRQLFDVVDDSIPKAGKTGLWTRGSTAVSFDDFRIDKKG